MIIDMIARLPGLTEVDGSMIPLEELDDTTKDSKVGTGLVGCIGCEQRITMSEGLYLYLGLTRVLTKYDSKDTEQTLLES
jgi:hypothetical protein